MPRSTSRRLRVNAFQAILNVFVAKHVRLSSEYSTYITPGVPPKLLTNAKLSNVESRRVASLRVAARRGALDKLGRTDEAIAEYQKFIAAAPPALQEPVDADRHRARARHPGFGQHRRREERSGDEPDAARRAGALALGAGVIFGISALGKQSDYTSDPSEKRAAAGDDAAAFSTIALTAGVILGAATVVLLLTMPPAADPPAKRASSGLRRDGLRLRF